MDPDRELSSRERKLSKKCKRKNLICTGGDDFDKCFYNEKLIIHYFGVWIEQSVKCQIVDINSRDNSICPLGKIGDIVAINSYDYHDILVTRSIDLNDVLGFEKKQKFRLEVNIDDKWEIRCKVIGKYRQPKSAVI